MDITIDGSLTMPSYVSTVCQSAFYHAVKPSSVDRMSVCVSCQLDYCNGLLYGIGDSQLWRLSLL